MKNLKLPVLKRTGIVIVQVIAGFPAVKYLRMRRAKICMLS